MSQLTLGVVGTARKPDEHRLPIHPDHLDRIPETLRTRIYLENGYGEPFGLADDEIRAQVGGFLPRGELLKQDIVLLPKPLPDDLRELREGTLLWGWPHCVQQEEITQVAIDRNLTLLAWEAMFTWRGEVRDCHSFYKNNEMAGYCAVLHSLELAGEDGLYGRPKRAVVLSFGSVARGAVYALQGRGVADIEVFTRRPPWSVRDQVPGCRYGQMLVGEDGQITCEDADGNERPLIDRLGDADVIVNGILQDTDRPLNYMGEGEEARLRRGALIVDVSCDLGMGFPFARPTSFADPVFQAGPATYYAVDHTPSYLWKSATWEISSVICEFLPRVMEGVGSWDDEPVLARAVEIRDGVIQNPKILSFQGRDPKYPHPIL